MFGHPIYPKLADAAPGLERDCIQIGLALPLSLVFQPYQITMPWNLPLEEKWGTSTFGLGLFTYNTSDKRGDGLTFAVFR